ncbi:T9SS type A sorting domain-containing protein [Carboxylicivirga mesophila]|uniref:T9SS type A sorting domain-containing protein n=1 Tax=Carboxylicivirga mesophila TaxID=1166478 RepID=A0ABS5KBC5_9BACT|nr:T9SS type A sorting domain-containing protein [Carboxylicivirga mesophila]MBS2212324.1 T9SS type A sorting domain-containing protein [Carboxylicivirga mesophila]
MKLSLTFLVTFLLIAPNFTKAQFEAINSNLRGLRNGDITFTDFDSDGDIDVLMIGDDIEANAFSLIYLNDNLSFTESAITSFPALMDGAFDWADYNNDGKMDLAVIGFTIPDGRLITEVHTHDGEFIKTDLELTGISRGGVDWGDYNNDGLPDLLIAGQDAESNSVTKLFENKGTYFSEVELPNVEGVSFGDVKWADYDGDGLLDFIISGVQGQAPETTPPVTKLYKNTGDGFEEVFKDTFIGVYVSSIEWGDADNDGDLDVIITGFTADYMGSTTLYINEGTLFRIHETGLPNILEGFAKWGDYNNDNQLDILISGNSLESPSKICAVYENKNLAFEKVFEHTGVGQSSGGWADLNNDDYLDFIVMGQTESLEMLATVFINEGGHESNTGNNALKQATATVNNPPSTPANLTSAVKDGKVTLSWDASTDDLTNSNSLSYSVNIFKDGQLHISSLSNESGKRSIVAPGNAGLQTFYVSENLPVGNYSWSVQAIDNSYSASSFSATNDFSIEEQVGLDADELDKSQVKIFPIPVKDQLFVEGINTPFTTQLFSINGTLVISEAQYNNGVNVSQLKNGIYLLKITSNNHTIHRKFIKK